MKTIPKLKHVLMSAVLASGTIGLNAQAGTGLCFFDPAFGQAWEINIIACDGNDCSLELDRPGFPTIPMASTGAMTITGSTFHANWNGAFSGTTQGTIHVACSIDVANGIPASGPGMEQRIANFSNPPVEFFTGSCRLALCSANAAAPPATVGDPQTGR